MLRIICVVDDCIGVDVIDIFDVYSYKKYDCGYNDKYRYFLFNLKF